MIYILLGFILWGVGLYKDLDICVYTAMIFFLGGSIVAAMREFISYCKKEHMMFIKVPKPEQQEEKSDD